MPIIPKFHVVIDFEYDNSGREDQVDDDLLSLCNEVDLFTGNACQSPRFTAVCDSLEEAEAVEAKANQILEGLEIGT